MKLTFTIRQGGRGLWAMVLGVWMSAGGLWGAGAVPGPISGEVVSVDEAGGRMALRVDYPKGSEPVEVTVGAGDAAIYVAGDRVRGELVRYGGGLRLQAVWPDDPVEVATMQRIGRQLQREGMRRGSKVFRMVGEQAPRYALWREDGSLFLSETLRGKYVVMNFIFTRCPVATMCPASTERMKRIQSRLGELGWEDVHLVSVTLDPEFDTPGVFTTYARVKEIRTENFSLLGGPVEIVESLKEQMGVLAEEDPEQIVRHTMSTALIDPRGKIIYRIPGSNWDPETFLRQIDRDRAEKAGGSPTLP